MEDKTKEIFASVKKSYCSVLQIGCIPTEVQGVTIAGLQSIPRESNDKDIVAMLEELTIEANEESFVIVLQHGGNDVNCNPRMALTILTLSCKMQINWFCVVNFIWNGFMLF